MYDKFFKKQIDYFWEFDYPFSAYFLKEIFHNNHKRKYSLSGTGIYNLIYVNGKVYEIKMTETKKMLEADGKKALRDTDKDWIVDNIVQAFDKENIEYSVNSGKFITFKIQNNYIAKLEIVKKSKEPE